MVVQHSERQNSLPAGSNGDRQNQLLKDHIHNVESPIATHTCYICNKTVQLRNFQQHLKSSIHARNLQATTDRDSNADIGPIQLESENVTSLIHDKSILLKIFNRSNITTLKSIPKNLRRNIAMATTCGRSGLTVSHLMEILYLGTNLDTELLTHVNYLVQGKAPLELAAFYASASLIALKKKDSSISPIAVGEIIIRLTSKICLTNSELGYRMLLKQSCMVSIA
jgi:hypothetical protein